MTTTPRKFLPTQVGEPTLYRFARSVRSVMGHLKLSLLPPQCVCCGKTFLAQKRPGLKPKLKRDEAKLQESLCVYCLQSLQKYRRVACKTCGLGLGPRLQQFGWTHCRHCRQAEDLHLKTWVCSDYEPPFDQWISSLKYGGAYEIAPFLAAWMSLRMRGPNGIQAHGLPWPDVWMAVPSHASKVKQRGYNQAALIAKALSGLTGIPYVKGVLIKTGETFSQAELSREERMLNLANAFVCRKQVNQNWVVGLVDDVMTTGSTLDLCTEALLKAGAKDVIRFAVCRTPE